MDSPEMQTGKKKKIIHTVILAKGIAIILVVIGHYFPENSPDYWIHVRDFIYLFHMPLFFILSGYLFQFSSINNINLFPGLIIKKIKRLIVPFLTVAAIFILVKIIIGNFLSLQHPVTLSSIRQLFINPAHSFAPLLWFLYTLFFIQILYQGIQLLLKNTCVIFIISLIIMLIPLPYTIFFYYIFQNLPYFIIGYFLGKIKNPDTMPLSIILISSSICLTSGILFLYIYQLSGPIPFVSRFLRLIIGTSLSILCIGISSMLARIRNLFFIRILTRIGLSAMGIYLLHTFFESFTRIIFRQIFSIDLPFIITAIFAILSGIIFPILVENLLLRRFKFTRIFILGIK